MGGAGQHDCNTMFLASIRCPACVCPVRSSHERTNSSLNFGLPLFFLAVKAPYVFLLQSRGYLQSTGRNLLFPAMLAFSGKYIKRHNECNCVSLFC